MKGKTTIWTFRVGTFLVGIGSICCGVMRNEHIDVLLKAVNVCLECIGIG